MRLKKTNNRGFTLVELLVVIAIIAVLAAISIPIGLRVYNSAKKTAAAAAMKQTVESVNAYYRGHNTLTYNISPSESGKSSADNPADGEAAEATAGYDAFIAALTGEGSGTQTRIKYLKLQDAKHADTEDVADGITRDSSNIAHGMVDPWGNPYHLQIDADYDEAIEIDCSGYTNETANGKRFAMISAGPDGEFGNEDDVQSYR